MKPRRLALLGLMALSLCSCSNSTTDTDGWKYDAYRICIDGSVTYEASSSNNLAYRELSYCDKVYSVLWVRYDVRGTSYNGDVPYRVTRKYVNHPYEIMTREQKTP